MLYRTTVPIIDKQMIKNKVYSWKVGKHQNTRQQEMKIRVLKMLIRLASTVE